MVLYAVIEYESDTVHDGPKELIKKKKNARWRTTSRDNGPDIGQPGARGRPGFHVWAG